RETGAAKETKGRPTCARIGAIKDCWKSAGGQAGSGISDVVSGKQGWSEAGLSFYGVARQSDSRSCSGRQSVGGYVFSPLSDQSVSNFRFSKKRQRQYA